MNEYSRKWWVVGLVGALLWPVLLLGLDGVVHRHNPAPTYQPYFDALAFAFAGTVGAIAVPTLPVSLGLRMLLFFLYIPLFLWAVNTMAPWVW